MSIVGRTAATLVRSIMFKLYKSSGDFVLLLFWIVCYLLLVAWSVWSYNVAKQWELKRVIRLGMWTSTAGEIVAATIIVCLICYSILG